MHTGCMSVIYQDVAVAPRVAPREPILAAAPWKRVPFDGIASVLGTLAGWLYLGRAHEIGAGVGWLLFLCGVAGFLLSIFAGVRHNRWWFSITLLAFVLLMTLAHTTEGCTYPCAL